MDEKTFKKEEQNVDTFLNKNEVRAAEAGERYRVQLLERGVRQEMADMLVVSYKTGFVEGYIEAFQSTRGFPC